MHTYNSCQLAGHRILLNRRLTLCINYLGTAPRGITARSKFTVSSTSALLKCGLMANGTLTYTQNDTVSTNRDHYMTRGQLTAQHTNIMAQCPENIWPDNRWCDSQPIQNKWSKKSQGKEELHRNTHTYRRTHHFNGHFPGKPRAISRTLFSYENLSSTAREFSRKCEMLRCENSTVNTFYRASQQTTVRLYGLF